MDEFENLSEVEKRWLRSRLSLLAGRDSWVMGSFAEHVVAEALPAAEESSNPIAAWDLTWEGIKIEVKCSTQRQMRTTENDKPSAELWRVAPHYAWDATASEWHPGDKRRWADVYVLARHEGFNHLDGWSFYVVPCAWLDGRLSDTVTGSTLRRAGWGPYKTAELARVIQHCAAAAAAGSEHGGIEGPGRADAEEQEHPQ